MKEGCRNKVAVPDFQGVAPGDVTLTLEVATPSGTYADAVAFHVMDLEMEAVGAFTLSPVFPADMTPGPGGGYEVLHNLVIDEPTDSPLPTCVILKASGTGAAADIFDEKRVEWKSVGEREALVTKLRYADADDPEKVLAMFPKHEIATVRELLDELALEWDGTFSLCLARLPEPGEFEIEAEYGVDPLTVKIKSRIPEMGDVTWFRRNSDGSMSEITGQNVHPTDGFGVRYFPDATAPDGEWEDVIYVRAMPQPVSPGVNVYFRALDPDDPSLNEGGNYGGDNDETGDNAGKFEVENGAENPGGKPTELRLEGLSARTDDAGVAWAKFRVSHRQGDNYRVAASCNLGKLAGIRQSDVAGWGPALPQFEFQEPATRVSTLMTIWRKGHVEVDCMAPVNQTNQVTGTIKSVIPVGGGNDWRICTNQVLDDSEKRFVPGTGYIVLPTGQTVALDIVSSSGPDLDFTLAGAGTIGIPPAAAVGLSFRIEDDDQPAVIPPTWPLDPIVMTGFRHAYIELVADTGLDSPNVTFTANEEDIEPVIRQFKGSQGWVGQYSSYKYWCPYLLAAYQGTKESDNDPDSEVKIEAGNTDMPGPVNLARRDCSIVYLEAIRDGCAESGQSHLYPIIVSGTTLHELCHQFTNSPAHCPSTSGHVCAMLAVNGNTQLCPIWIRKLRQVNKVNPQFLGDISR